MTLRNFALISAAIALSACSVGPDYVAPNINLADRFAEGGARPIGNVAAHRWWTAFNDPVLDDLVTRGLGQNLDIRSALARVAEAQAAARATGLPAQVSGSLTGEIVRSGGGNATTSTSESSSLNPSIILDIFGGERRSREQALATLQSTELDVGTARLAYISSIVSNYIDLRYYQEALAITRQTIASRRETLRLVENQQRAGTATELSVAQAQANVDDALASLPSYEAGFYASAYAIATLIAEPVQRIETRLERGAAQPMPRGGTNSGVPADLLRNRPDIGAAEREYAAAIAAIGVSEAELYPSLTLGGTIAASDSTTWSFGPNISIPLLNQGVLRANRDGAIALAEQSQLTWRASVLAAVEEVQVAQSDTSRNRRAAAANRRSVESYQRVVTLSEQTFEAGTTTLLDLLDSQRSLFSARLSLASANRDFAASWASLQIASGRGWFLN